MKIHEKYMDRCLQLAANGLGQTYPNPMVGSVIVYQDRIIGEGWHRKAGQPHAEVVAVNSVKEKQLLPEATLYVNLEPCNHHGRTPPCSELIVQSGIKQVVVSKLDPNPKVAGTGIKRLQAAGIDVVQGVLEKKSIALNKRFLTYHEHKRPYVVLKWAQSTDGYLAPTEQNKDQPFWISNPYSRQQAHRLRANEQAILIGSETLRKDNPGLDTRDWWGDSPLALIWTSTGQLPMDRQLWDTKADKIILISGDTETNIEELPASSARGIKEPIDILNLLYEQGIQSLIVEGGARVLQQFVNSGLWDEALIFEGAASISNGIKAPEIQYVESEEIDLLDDRCVLYKRSL